MRQSYPRLAVLFTLLIGLVLSHPLLRAQVIIQPPPPGNCAVDTELRFSSGQTAITINYPQNPAARAPATVQVSDVQLTMPTVSSEDYAAKKAAIAAYSKQSFLGPPTLEIVGPTGPAPMA